MTNRNFEKARRFARVASRGHDPVSGADLSGGIRKPAKHKSSLRAETNDLMHGQMMTKAISCRCGHRGKVRIPVENAAGPFRCVKCGSRIEGRNG